MVKGLSLSNGLGPAELEKVTEATEVWGSPRKMLLPTWLLPDSREAVMMYKWIVERAKSCNLRFNIIKCYTCQSSMTYIKHPITAERTRESGSCLVLSLDEAGIHHFFKPLYLTIELYIETSVKWMHRNSSSLSGMWSLSGIHHSNKNLTKTIELCILPWELKYFYPTKPFDILWH